MAWDKRWHNLVLVFCLIEDMALSLFILETAYSTERNHVRKGESFNIVLSWGREREKDQNKWAILTSEFTLHRHSTGWHWDVILYLWGRSNGKVILYITSMISDIWSSFIESFLIIPIINHEGDRVAIIIFILQIRILRFIEFEIYWGA